MPARILCVDDEPLIRSLLTHYVEELGHAPLQAASGEEALEILGRTPINLLITDIRLGGIDGWQVAEQARTDHPSMPVIYISGFPSKGKSVSGAIYLAKPFRPRELEAAIRRQLDQLADA